MCSVCFQFLSPSAFSRAKACRGGRDGVCKQCKAIRNKLRAEQRRKNPPVSKACSKCRIDKGIAEYSINEGTKDGYLNICKVCVAMALPKGTIMEKQRKIKLARKEKPCIACQVVKPLEQFNIVSARVDGRASKCRDCSVARQREIARANKESMAEYKRKWAVENDDRVRAARYNYHARKNNAEGVLTPDEVKKVFDTYGRICLACGSTENIQVDHVVPLSLGGTNLFDNLQPLCGFCNKSKRNRSCIDYRKEVQGAGRAQA